MIIASVGIVGDTQGASRLAGGRIVVQGKGYDRPGSLEQQSRVTAQVTVPLGPPHAAVVPLVNPTVISRNRLIVDRRGSGKATSVKSQARGLGLDQ